MAAVDGKRLSFLAVMYSYYQLDEIELEDVVICFPQNTQEDWRLGESQGID